MPVRAAIAAALVMAVVPLGAATADEPDTPTLDAGPTVSDVRAVIDTAITYETTVRHATELQAKAKERREKAVVAKAAARKVSVEVADYLVSPMADPMVGKMLAVQEARSSTDLVDALMLQDQVSTVKQDRLTVARRLTDTYLRHNEAAKSAEKQAADAGARAETLLNRMNDQAQAIGLGSATAPTGLPSTQTEQTTWNREAAARWRAYKNRVDEAGLTFPTAKAVRKDPTKSIVPSSTSENGVGTLLPVETVRFVDTLIKRVGEPYTGKDGQGRWTCSSLLTDTKSGTYTLDGSPADLFETTKKVPTRTKRIGDLIFLANDKSGIHHVGVYVGDGKMIDAPATRYTVGISSVPDRPYAVTRPSLGKGDNTAPKGSERKPTTVCNANLPAKITGWRLPMKRGTYTLTAGFGESGKYWARRHTGQDFAAPVGTPIYASRGGVVSIESNSWAGRLITVTRPDGSADRYAHTSKQLVEDGDIVEAGQEIALIGSEGNVTGPHLHFEIIQPDGEMVDPLPLLLKYLPTEGGPDAWGGYGNGRVPLPVLCPVRGGFSLRCDAAADLTRLADEYARKFSRPLALANAYKPIVDQIVIDENGALGDLPGTSPFGWGLRISVEGADSAEQKWLSEHANDHGWKPVGDGQYTYTRR